MTFVSVTYTPYIVTGKDVRRIRKRLGLSQPQLAERLGVTKNSVARWERGEMGIRQSVVILLGLLEQSSPKRKDH